MSSHTAPAKPQKESVKHLWTRRWEQSEQTDPRNIYRDLIKEPFIKIPGWDSALVQGFGSTLNRIK